MVAHHLGRLGSDWRAGHFKKVYFWTRRERVVRRWGSQYFGSLAALHDSTMVSAANDGARWQTNTWPVWDRFQDKAHSKSSSVAKIISRGPPCCRAGDGTWKPTKKDAATCLRAGGWWNLAPGTWALGCSRGSISGARWPTLIIEANVLQTTTSSSKSKLPAPKSRVLLQFHPS